MPPESSSARDKGQSPGFGILCGYRSAPEDDGVLASLAPCPGQALLSSVSVIHRPFLLSPYLSTWVCHDFGSLAGQSMGGRTQHLTGPESQWVPTSLRCFGPVA